MFLPEATPSLPPASSCKLSIPRAELPGIGEILTCRAVHHDGSYFYIVEQSKLEQLHSALQQLSLDKEVGVATADWEVGQVALGLYGDEWCRIMYEGAGDAYYHAYFVDYGSHGMVTHLADIPADLCVLPVLAIRCTCVDIADYSSVFKAEVKVSATFYAVHFTVCSQILDHHFDDITQPLHQYFCLVGPN